MTFVIAVNYLADIVDIEIDKIHNAMIRIKILAIIKDIMGMTFLEFLVIRIFKTIIDNWVW